MQVNIKHNNGTIRKLMAQASPKSAWPKSYPDMEGGPPIDPFPSHIHGINGITLV